MTAKPSATRVCNEQPCAEPPTIKLTTSYNYSIITGTQSIMIPLYIKMMYSTNDSYTDNTEIGSLNIDSYSTSGGDIPFVLSRDVPEAYRQYIFVAIYAYRDGAAIDTTQIRLSFYATPDSAPDSPYACSTEMWTGFTGSLATAPGKSFPPVPTYAHTGKLTASMSQRTQVCYRWDSTYGCTASSSRPSLCNIGPEVGDTITGLTVQGGGQKTYVTAFGIDLYEWA